MKRFLLLAFVAIATAGLLTGSAMADHDDDDRGGTKHWQVTIENVTPPGPGAPGSQPLSPPLLVVHSGKADVWSVGDIASHPVAAIAEDANNGPAESALEQLRGVVMSSPAREVRSRGARRGRSWSRRAANSTG